MEISKYIERIGFKGVPNVSIHCLKSLHKCHIMSIPFEALDVQLEKSITLNLREIYHKVVEGNRGGYCYELNYLFNWLLNKLGFKSHIIAAQIFNDGRFGPKFDHMAICVILDQIWLVDVGYGDLFIQPIRLSHDVEQEDLFKFYKIRKLKNNEYLLQESLDKGQPYLNRYKFELSPKRIEEFQEQNIFKQRSVDSYFVKNLVCTIATDTGRKTVLNNTFKCKTKKLTTERVIKNHKELNEILKNEFSIDVMMKSLVTGKD